jgi:hypothetical protein
LAKLRIIREEEELKECCFQPNLNKSTPRNVSETFFKLHEDGYNKAKLKRQLATEGKKEIPLNPKDYTFNPKVNHL